MLTRSTYWTHDNDDYSDEDILEDPSFWEDIEVRQMNRQCYYCAGWWWYCSCELGYEPEKRAFQRYLELRENEVNIGT